MSVNSDFLKERLAFSKKYIDRLKKIQSIPKEEFLQDFPIQLQTERIFEIITLIMLDVCTHIVAHSKETPPASYSDCMQKLADLNVISKENVSTYIKIIKMRNIIVHQYGEVDFEIVHSSLELLNEDFQNFKEQILTWLEKQN
ncbi:MAG: DUF86 domain-containing protein [Candidatus Heimdallarchaeota archaeon]|nr:DUF86 domain-containing protein [Candidatus Heimdallarchaeota archaeon]